MKATMVDSKLAHYLTLFKKHTMLKLESLTWKQKIIRTLSNEFKGELESLLNVTPTFTFINKATYCHCLVTY